MLLLLYGKSNKFKFKCITRRFIKGFTQELNTVKTPLDYEKSLDI